MLDQMTVDEQNFWSLRAEGKINKEKIRQARENLIEALKPFKMEEVYEADKKETEKWLNNIVNIYNKSGLKLSEDDGVLGKLVKAKKQLDIAMGTGKAGEESLRKIEKLFFGIGGDDGLAGGIDKADKKLESFLNTMDKAMWDMYIRQINDMADNSVKYVTQLDLMASGMKAYNDERERFTYFGDKGIQGLNFSLGGKVPKENKNAGLEGEGALIDVNAETYEAGYKSAFENIQKDFKSHGQRMATIGKKDAEILIGTVHSIGSAWSDFFFNSMKNMRNMGNFFKSLMGEIRDAFIRMIADMIEQRMEAAMLGALVNIGLGIATGGPGAFAGEVIPPGIGTGGSYTKGGFFTGAEKGGYFPSYNKKEELPKFDTGGWFTGSGSKRGFPAWLHPKEYVIPENYLERMIGVLCSQFIQSGSMPQPNLSFMGAGRSNITAVVNVYGADLSDSKTQRRIGKQIVDMIYETNRGRI